jgi:hypothetical protein
MKNFIKCPYCGYEYVPSEIYYPGDLLGHPKNIYRDIDGKIEKVDKKASLTETYTCDKCDKMFKVSANICFATSKLEELNFDDDYAVPLYKDRITLEE